MHAAPTPARSSVGVSETKNPHREVPLAVEGAPLESAALAVVLVHGRTLDPSYMREHVSAHLDRSDLAYVYPGADGNTWYPESFLRPIEENQPRLGWALERIDDVRLLLEENGVKDNRIVWLGFSQGACLVAEYVARSSHRFAGLICFTGGLIGPTEPELTRPTGVQGMPTLFTSSDIDEFVPLYRVEETVEIFRSAGARIELGITYGTPHEIPPESIERCRTFLRLVTGTSGSA
jgi:phospholipase/carboxylesterase